VAVVLCNEHVTRCIPVRSQRFRHGSIFSTTAASLEYFRARRVSAASPGGKK